MCRRLCWTINRKRYLGHLQSVLVTPLAMLQDTVNFPVHLKNFNLSQLRQLCKELRSDIVHTVSKTGGAKTAHLLTNVSSMLSLPSCICPLRCLRP